MPDLILRLPVFVAHQYDGAILACPLHFPELSALADKPTTCLRHLETVVAKQISLLPLIEHYQYRAVGDPEIKTHQLTFPPSGDGRGWQNEVVLTFHSVRWQHGREGNVAYVPILDIGVVAASESQLDAMLESHIRFALMRQRRASKLADLAWLDCYESVELVSTSVTVHVPTPKEFALEEKEGTAPSVLIEVATRISPRQEVHCRGALVAQLAEGLTAERPQSAILVGASGVGKTAIVDQLVREAEQRGLGDYSFWATTGARIISGMGGFGMWQERCQGLCREVTGKKVIIHFGSLMELLEVGKSIANQQGVAAFLRPYLLRGDLLAIFECTRHQWSLIEQEMPAMLDCLRRLDVEEPTQLESRTILERSAEGWGHRVPRDVIEQVDRLHRRYATYSANPGRPLTFLRNLLDDTPRDEVNDSRVTEVFSDQTGLPLAFLDDTVTLDLEQVHARLASRVIGQDDAVRLIVELMATIKAGLTQPGRPIASLLFIGPTGVGKTELAKAVAEFFYQDVNRLTRFDMSEYADLFSVDRLIGGTWQQEGALTAKIREQPFSVVLFDEFEKAHPRFFDLLLQILGEGRLTDSAGRLADFSNTVIIMTSNLGAEDRRGAELGFVDTGSDTQSRRLREHYVRSVREFVRPELFNRIDRLVPFGTLPHGVVRRIACRELDKLLHRDGVLYRRLTLEWSDSTPDFLAQQGYDPRYGARPLKRLVERALLAPLAGALNRYSSETPLVASIDVVDGRLRVDVAGVVGKAASEERPILIALANQSAVIRRDAMAMESSHVVLQLENEIFPLERLEARAIHEEMMPPNAAPLLRQLAQLRELKRRIVSFRESAVQLEQDVLLPLYEQKPLSIVDCEARVKECASERTSLLITCYSRDIVDSNRILLVLYGESSVGLWDQLQVYTGIAERQAYTKSLHELTVLKGDELKRYRKNGKIPAGYLMLGPVRDHRATDGRDLILGRVVADHGEFLDHPREGVIGVVIGLRGDHVRPLLEGEAGRHTWRISGKEHHCLVDVCTKPLQDYEPIENISRMGQIARQPHHRTYSGDTGATFESAESGTVREESLIDGVWEWIQRGLVTKAEKWMGLRK